MDQAYHLLQSLAFLFYIAENKEAIIGASVASLILVTSVDNFSVCMYVCMYVCMLW